MQENKAYFKADASSDIWKAYVDNIDEMVIDGFFNTIHCSLKFMLGNTDAKAEVLPLFVAYLELMVCYLVIL